MTLQSTYSPELRTHSSINASGFQSTSPPSPFAPVEFQCGGNLHGARSPRCRSAALRYVEPVLLALQSAFFSPQRAAAPAPPSNPSHRFLAPRSPAAACWGLSHSLAFLLPAAPLSSLPHRQQQQHRSHRRRRHHPERRRSPYSFMKPSRHRPQRRAAQRSAAHRRTGAPDSQRRSAEGGSSSSGSSGGDLQGRPARLQRLQRRAQTSCPSARRAISVSASVSRPCG